MKIWLIVMMVVLALMAVDIIVVDGQDTGSWNPRSSIPLKRGGSMSISQGDLDSLKKWVGKYPILFEDSPQKWRPPSKSFFELPLIRQGLINLPHDDFKNIAAEVDWLITPIELFSNHLVIRKRCRGDSCGSEKENLVVVSLYDGSMHVSFWDDGEENSRKIRWFSTKGNYKDLPKEILDAWHSTSAPEMPVSKRGPVSDAATPIANLPSGWQGGCRESPRAEAYCAVWLDGPGPSRLLFMARLKGGGYVQLILPYTPDILLMGVETVGYVELDRTLWSPRQFADMLAYRLPSIYSKSQPQPTLRLRLVRGGKRQDIGLPMGGYIQAIDRLGGEERRQEAQDRQRVFDATR
jgi:hypothetical protein